MDELARAFQPMRGFESTLKPAPDV
jgi:hypothetical protein